MPSSSFLAKLLENEVLGIQMKFEKKLRNYIISKEQKYFVRTTRLFCQANQRILSSQKMIYWADKKISLPQKNILLDQHNSFVRLTKRPNNKIFLAQQNNFFAQITTKLFYCGNKILVGHAKPFSQWYKHKIQIFLIRQNSLKKYKFAFEMINKIWWSQVSNCSPMFGIYVKLNLCCLAGWIKSKCIQIDLLFHVIISCVLIYTSSLGFCSYQYKFSHLLLVGIFNVFLCALA